MLSWTVFIRLFWCSRLGGGIDEATYSYRYQQQRWSRFSVTLCWRCWEKVKFQCYSLLHIATKVQMFHCLFSSRRCWKYLKMVETFRWYFLAADGDKEAGVSVSCYRCWLKVKRLQYNFLVADGDKGESVSFMSRCRCWQNVKFQCHFPSSDGD